MIIHNRPEAALYVFEPYSLPKFRKETKWYKQANWNEHQPMAGFSEIKSLDRICLVLNELLQKVRSKYQEKIYRRLLTASSLNCSQIYGRWTSAYIWATSFPFWRSCHLAISENSRICLLFYVNTVQVSELKFFVVRLFFREIFESNSQNLSEIHWIVFTWAGAHNKVEIQVNSKDNIYIYIYIYICSLYKNTSLRKVE